MKKKLMILSLALSCFACMSMAESLTLSLKEAQDYAIEQNKSLQNASLEVKKAYAQRWETIAAMLPQVSGSVAYQNMCGYEMDFSGMKMTMPSYITHGVSASIAINGQLILGALLNNIAIEMQDINLKQSESNLRANVMTSYMAVLVMEDIVDLLDSSLVNIEKLAEMTQHTVDVGAAEQTSADQLLVKVNALKNSINSNKRNVELSRNSLKVLLGVGPDTELTLSQSLDDILSAEAALNLLNEDFNINNNYNYQLLVKNKDLAQRNIEMAAMAYTPTVSLAYQYSHRKNFEEGGFNMTPPNLVAINVSIPIFTSGKTAATIREKRVAMIEAENTLAETTDNLGIQNQQLRFNLANAYETYVNEKDNIDVTKRVFQNVTNKFQWGAASSLELTNASNDLISAQSTYVQAVLSLVNAQVELEKFLNN